MDFQMNLLSSRAWFELTMKMGKVEFELELCLTDSLRQKNMKGNKADQLFKTMKTIVEGE